MAFKLKEIFTGEEDENEVNDYEIKETAKKSTNKDIKNKTILVEPRAFSEAQQIADYLKTNNQVVVNFKRVTSENKRKRR